MFKITAFQCNVHIAFTGFTGYGRSVTLLIDPIVGYAMATYGNSPEFPLSIFFISEGII